jgi:SAM-dependent methyltransferase
VSLLRRLRSLIQVGIDRLLRVRTTEREAASLLGLREHEMGLYHVSGWIGTWRVIHAMRPREGDVFLDVGSGAGRTVCVASRFPFRRVIGVEREPKLHRLAQENLRNVRWPGRAETELVCADIAEYPIPDDVTVVYLYNPIFNEAMEAFVGRLIASVDRSPRPVRIAYLNPQHEDRLLAGGRGRIRKIGRLHNSLRLQPEKARSYLTVLYQVLPAER